MLKQIFVLCAVVVVAESHLEEVNPRTFHHDRYQPPKKQPPPPKTHPGEINYQYGYGGFMHHPINQLFDPKEKTNVEFNVNVQHNQYRPGHHPYPGKSTAGNSLYPGNSGAATSSYTGKVGSENSTYPANGGSQKYLYTKINAADKYPYPGKGTAGNSLYPGNSGTGTYSYNGMVGSVNSTYPANGDTDIYPYTTINGSDNYPYTKISGHYSYPGNKDSPGPIRDCVPREHYNANNNDEIYDFDDFTRTRRHNYDNYDENPNYYGYAEYFFSFGQLRKRRETRETSASSPKTNSGDHNHYYLNQEGYQSDDLDCSKLDEIVSLGGANIHYDIPLTIYERGALTKTNTQEVHKLSKIYNKFNVVIAIPGSSNFEDSHQDKFVSVFADAFRYYDDYIVLGVLMDYTTSNFSVENFLEAYSWSQKLAESINKARNLNSDKKIIVLAEGIGTVVPMIMRRILHRPLDVVYGIDEEKLPGCCGTMFNLRTDAGLLVQTISSNPPIHSYLVHRNFILPGTHHYRVLARVIKEHQILILTFCTNYQDYVVGKCRTMPTANLWSHDVSVIPGRYYCAYCTNS